MSTYYAYFGQYFEDEFDKMSDEMKLIKESFTHRIFFDRSNYSYSNTIHVNLSKLEATTYCIGIYFPPQLCENDSDYKINLDSDRRYYQNKRLIISGESYIFDKNSNISDQLKNTIHTFIEVKKDLIKQVKIKYQKKLVKKIILLVTGKYF
jgi:hypothetical protein